MTEPSEAPDDDDASDLLESLDADDWRDLVTRAERFPIESPDTLDVCR